MTIRNSSFDAGETPVERIPDPVADESSASDVQRTVEQEAAHQLPQDVASVAKSIGLAVRRLVEFTQQLAVDNPADGSGTVKTSGEQSADIDLA